VSSVARGNGQWGHRTVVWSHTGAVIATTIPSPAAVAVAVVDVAVVRMAVTVLR
jgi:hypothetical protein